jgi:hypothetical protein
VGALVVTAITIGFLTWLGIQVWGVPDKYFRERRAGTYYSGLLLLAAGALAFAASRRAGESAARRFWVVAALGFVYLAADDMLSLHEEADRALHRLVGWYPRHWLTDHLDDAIVASYGVFAALWGFRHRRVLLTLRWTCLLLAVGFAGFAAMVVVDALAHRPVLEESLKLLAETVIALGVLAAYLDLARPGRRGS